MIDELSIAMKAREFIRLSGPSALPVSIDAYASQINGIVAEEALGRTRMPGLSGTAGASSASA